MRYSLFKNIPAAVFFGLLMITAGYAEESKSREPVSEASNVEKINAEEAVLSPYGVCAHLFGDSLAEEKLKLMHEAGIASARYDLHWGSVQTAGGWNFSEADRLVRLARENNVSFLPILTERGELKPTKNHIPEFQEYVRQTAAHFLGQQTYWEVINEPNLSMIHGPELPAEDYTVLLKAAYEAVKSVNPKLQVVHGGYAGAAADYFADELKIGAADCFDVMNIHCYRGGMHYPESVQWFADDIAKIQKLLDQYGIGEKPIWVTETGFASLPSFAELNNRIMEMGFDALISETAGKKFAFLYDENYRPCLFYQPEEIARMFPETLEKDQVVSLKLADLKGISPNDYAVVLLPPGESFPIDYFDDLVEYVRSGGNLFLLGGVPFRYGASAGKDAVRVYDDYRKVFRLDYLDQAKCASVPRIARCRVPEEVFPGLNSRMKAMVDGFGDTYQTTRYLSNDRLSDADKVKILYYAQEGDFTAPVIETVRPEGFAGSLFISTFNELETTNLCFENEHAVFLPQLMLTALSSGAARCFWYEFQCPDEPVTIDKEDYFGLTQKDLTPRDAYYAYKTLIENRPADVTNKSFAIEGDFVKTGWTLSDGTPCWGIWSPMGEKTAQLKIDGKILRAVDYLGNPVEIYDGKNLTLSEKVIYFTGPKNIELLP